MQVPSKHHNVSANSRITLIRQAYYVWGVVFLEEEDVELRNLILLITIHFKL